VRKALGLAELEIAGRGQSEAEEVYPEVRIDQAEGDQRLLIQEEEDLLELVAELATGSAELGSAASSLLRSLR
jgi:hypothetical protein